MLPVIGSLSSSGRRRQAISCGPEGMTACSWRHFMFYGDCSGHFVNLFGLTSNLLR